jgi:hypothetical protein
MDTQIYKPAFIAILLCLVVVACNSELEEEITWKLGEHPDMLVVEGLVTNRMERQVVYLSKTGEYLTNEPSEAVSDAIITVSDGFQVYTYSENDSINGEYSSDSQFIGIPFRSYSIQITLANPLNNQAEYTAQSIMPDGLNMDTIICEIYPMPDFGFDTGDELDTTLLGIYYYGKESDNPENYYLAAISGSNFPGRKSATNLVRFTDDQNNGSQSDFILFIQNVISDDTITFEVASVERDYYDYIGSIQQMEQSGSAYSMSGPPANAVGNIAGALGYFNTAYISKKKGIAKKNLRF